MSDTVIYIAYGICSFIILVEIFYSFNNQKKLYSLRDSWQNYLTLILFSLLYKYVFVIGMVVWLEKLNHFHFFEWNWNTVTPWIVLIIVYDFLYYWMHRMEHSLKILWKTSHVHHHSSRFLNFFTGFRSSFLQPFYLPFFVFPLFILGFNGLEVGWAIVTNKLYNFWTHQQHLGKIPLLDKIFNTPSNHRVHHGRNTQYIDKNFGGIFIIWDKLFGTYEPEGEKVDFGIQKDPSLISTVDFLKIGF